MSNFTSAEQRATGAAFDAFVEHTAAVLRDPKIVAQLGDTALELQQLNTSAFLPNMRGGKFVMPPSHERTLNVAVVPLTEEQATNAYGLVAPLYESSPWVWPIRGAAVSKRYGLELSQELASLFEDVPREAAAGPTALGLNPRDFANMRPRYDRIQPGIYATSRPVVLIRSEVLEGGQIAAAGIHAHELVHASDLLTDGPLLATRTYRGASELRAHHVSADIFGMSTDDVPGKETSLRINALRQQQIGATPYPYAPTPELMQKMAANGII